jgi:hypothetical protein
MGKHALLEEDARRALGATPPPPPPSGYSIPTYAITHTPGMQWNGYANLAQAFVFHTSPNVPSGSWGGIPVKQFRTPQADAVNGSWEWWFLYEHYIPTDWPQASEMSMYMCGFECHTVPGDVGWNDGGEGVPGTAPIQTSYKGGRFHIQHEGNYPNHIFQYGPNPIPKGVWHSIAVRTIFGRMDGTVPVAGHPNNGKGRTRIYLNGTQALDTGDITILYRRPSDGAILSKGDMFEGIYTRPPSASLVSYTTAVRMGRTLAEAQADTGTVLNGSQLADTYVGPGANLGPAFYTVQTPRTSSDFVAPVV